MPGQSAINWYNLLSHVIQPFLIRRLRGTRLASYPRPVDRELTGR